MQNARGGGLAGADSAAGGDDERVRV
jgi:hypothetical protein